MSQKAPIFEMLSAEFQGEVASKEGNGASLFVSVDKDLVTKPDQEPRLVVLGRE